jgi:hypothetical protein
VYNPILDVLADHKIKSLAQIEQALKAGEQAISFAQILQAVMILSASGAILPVQDDAAITKTKKTSEKLNLHLMGKARANKELSYLTSPVTGGGIVVPRFHQLFVLARSQGHKQAEDWAKFVWGVLAMQGQRLLKEGQTLETEAENVAELTAQADEFASKQLPILKALQIA